MHVRLFHAAGQSKLSGTNVERYMKRSADHLISSDHTSGEGAQKGKKGYEINCVIYPRGRGPFARKDRLLYGTVPLWFGSAREGPAECQWFLAPFGHARCRLRPVLTCTLRSMRERGSFLVLRVAIERVGQGGRDGRVTGFWLLGMLSSCSSR